MDRAKKDSRQVYATAIARYAAGETVKPTKPAFNQPAGLGLKRLWGGILARSRHGVWGTKEPGVAKRRAEAERLVQEAELMQAKQRVQEANPGQEAQTIQDAERRQASRLTIPVKMPGTPADAKGGEEPDPAISEVVVAKISNTLVAAKECFEEMKEHQTEPAESNANRKARPFPPPRRVQDRRKGPPAPLQGTMEEEMMQLHQMVVATLRQSNHIILQFSGSVRGEGTTAVAREFARVSATRFKKKTLLFDADWRQVTLHPLSRRTDPVAMEKVVRNGLPLERALRCIQKPLLYTCLLSADRDFCPDLYELPAMKNAWLHLKESFDVVVVDSPPAAEYPDSALIAQDVDGVIFVLKAESTKCALALAAKQLITGNGGKILGAVLNDRRFYVPDPLYRRL